jgi:hypothetical protein
MTNISKKNSQLENAKQHREEASESRREQIFSSM